MQVNNKIIGLVLPSVPGYSETFFYNKINGLLAKGYDVKLFVGKKAAKKPANWKVYKQPPVMHNPLMILFLVVHILQLLLKRPRIFYRFLKQEQNSKRNLLEICKNLYLNSHILREKVDWLHFGFSVTGINRENVAHAIGAKCSVSLRGYGISIFPLKNPGCFELLWQRLDKVHSISEALLQKAWQYGLSSEIPYKIIPPAINTTIFERISPVEIKSSVNIITVSRLVWKKGLEFALQAMAILKKLGIDISYTIIGEGEDWERLHFARYQLVLENEVTFTGKVAHDKIPTYLSNHQIYLQPSIQEGFCNAVLEAQAAGLLCVVSDAEGLPENVMHEKTGWVVPRYDSEAIANQIQQILSMSESEQQVVKNTARKRVKQEFDIKEQVDVFVQFYEDGDRRP